MPSTGNYSRTFIKSGKSNEVMFHVKGIVDYYNIPLRRAINKLYEYGYSFQRVANEVFGGQVSRTAVNLRFPKPKEIIKKKTLINKLSKK